MTFECRPHGCDGVSHVDIYGRKLSKEELQRTEVGIHLGVEDGQYDQKGVIET